MEDRKIPTLCTLGSNLRLTTHIFKVNPFHYPLTNGVPVTLMLTHTIPYVVIQTGIEHHYVHLRLENNQAAATNFLTSTTRQLPVHKPLHRYVIHINIYLCTRNGRARTLFILNISKS